MKLLNKLKTWITNESIQSYVWIAALIGVWEIASRSGWVNRYLLPPFSSTVRQLFTELTENDLGRMVWNSLQMVIIGTLLSVALAILITLLCVWLKPFENLFKALCVVFNPLPGMAVMPLIIMWFGLGTESMMALIVHGVVWPLATELLAGIRSIPKIYRDFAKNIGINIVEETVSVLLFAVMPHFLSGLRIGWGRSWRALISAEMVFGVVGSMGGIGYYIFQQRAYGNLTKVMCGVILIVFIGIIIEQCVFRLIEKRTIVKWGMTND